MDNCCSDNIARLNRVKNAALHLIMIGIKTTLAIVLKIKKKRKTTPWRKDKNKKCADREKSPKDHKLHDRTQANRFKQHSTNH